MPGNRSLAGPHVPQPPGRGPRVPRRTLATNEAACLLMLLATGCQHSATPPPVPVPHVQVTPVVQKDVPVCSEWVATLDGYVNAQIQPQVTGYLLRQLFREGSFVRKGEVLFEIDPRPLQAALDQTRAQLAQSQANVTRAPGGQSCEQ